jgi:hypothetical protein
MIFKSAGGISKTQSRRGRPRTERGSALDPRFGGIGTPARRLFLNGKA